MKVKIKENKGSSVGTPFPKLMISESGTIVLFQESDKGVCLKDGCLTFKKVGQYTNDWSMHYFTDFDGKVTLSND